MTRLRNHLLFLMVAIVSGFLMVQYLRLLQPAQARSVQAACAGLRPSITNPEFGKMEPLVEAKNFSLLDQQGKTFSLEQFRGKIVIVNFWASWCSVCRSEKPSLEKLQSHYDSSDVVVLALASDKDWAPVKRAILGFEVASANEVLSEPRVHGVRDPKQLNGSGQQILVVRVDTNRSADKGGLQRLDRIVSVNGNPVEKSSDLDEALRSSANIVKLVVSRAGTTKALTLHQEKHFEVLLDKPQGDGNLGAVAKSYGITAVPETFIVDREGKIRHYLINKRNWDGDIASTCLQHLVDG